MKPLIPTVRDWLLAAPTAAESQPRVHVCGSVRARKCREEEAAHDCSPGHMQLLPVKVPLASLHCIRALNPREYTERRSEGGHPSSRMQRMKSFYSLPQCPAYRCNSLPLVTEMNCHSSRTAATQFSPHTHRSLITAHHASIVNIDYVTNKDKEQVYLISTLETSSFLGFVIFIECSPLIKVN